MGILDPEAFAAGEMRLDPELSRRAFERLETPLDLDQRVTFTYRIAVNNIAEEITNIAQPGLILTQGQTIATYAPTGTGIEFGWSTVNGTTLAVATRGYEEGQVTPAGRAIRIWLNALGANAGPS